MKIIDYTEPLSDGNLPAPYYQKRHPHERLLFFDIETTGFAAANTTLYLIGVLWYENDSIYLRQWFNEDGYSEEVILKSFDTFCKEYDGLVHFNGLGFDIPYLRQKAADYNQNNPSWENLQQIDIFRLIRPYKKIFGLNSMKQTQIEEYLGIQREDTYTGKDLIHIYQRYIARPNDTEERLLLLHNHDDLLGMPQISSILNYNLFFEHIKPSHIQFEKKESQLCITFQQDYPAPLPQRIAITKQSIYLNAYGQQALLLIPLLRTTYRHYFKDYKNYYYLPQEDMAVHKSVAAYVDPYSRIKATKNNCYVKKNDTFLPCPCPEKFDIFQEEPCSKTYYQTLDSLLEAPEDKQIHYIRSILERFL